MGRDIPTAYKNSLEGTVESEFADIAIRILSLLGWMNSKTSIKLKYGVPFSVDDERGGSHTELFWKGIHTKEEIVNLIKNNQFLARQFKMDEAIKDVATVCGVRYKDVISAINMTQAFAGGKKKGI